MSTSDSRPAFRLPWQSAPDAENTDEQAPASTVEPPAWPHHDLIRRTGAGPEPASATEPARDAAGPSTGEAQPTPRPAGLGPGLPAPDPESTPPPTREVPAPVHRRPTKFLADLTRAMRQAADESRDATLAQCQSDVASHIEAARIQAEMAAGQARRRADDDLASLAEWSRSETERIERESAENGAARHVDLENELAEQQARLELELERVADQVRSFEREMETFFVQLLNEEDPSAFAAIASQLPEPPVFEPWQPDMDPTASDSPFHPPAEAAGNGTRNGSKKSRAATADAANAADGDAPPVAAELTVDEVEARIDVAHPGMPAMRPDDFAAAEAEAAHWASDGPGATDTHTPAAASAGAGHLQPVAGEPTAVAVEPTSIDGVARPRPHAVPSQPSDGARTQISVTGLVSVASIAAFKRLISRVQGVNAVQVASGPEGEFLFAVAHEERVDLAAAIVKLQGFETEVLNADEGLITVRASDPEAA